MKNMRPQKDLALFSVLLAFAVFGGFPGVAAGVELELVDDFGSNPGNLSMYYYLPEEISVPTPLVVVLHGCTQSVEAIANTGWLELSEEFGFALVFPRQSIVNNPSGCFNWAGEYGNMANIERGRGENMSIVQMVDFMEQLVEVDHEHVHITGFSSGGAMAAIMLAVWPDVFESGALVAGIPYACSLYPWEAQPCINPGIDRGPGEWAERVREAFPEYEGPYPRISLWQNSRDPVVNVQNLDELLEQWTEVHGVDRIPDEIIASGPATRERYADDHGVVLVETNLVEQSGHGVPINADADCGEPSTYVVDSGICFARESVEFFGLLSGDGETPGGGDGPGGIGDGVRSASGLDERKVFQADEAPALHRLDESSRDSSDDPDPKAGGCQTSGAGGASGLSLLVLLGLWALRRQNCSRRSSRTASVLGSIRI